MALGSGSSLVSDCSTRRKGSPASLKLCKFGWATLLHQHSSSKPATQSGSSFAILISSSRRLFFSHIRGRERSSNATFSSLPAHSYPRQSSPNGLPTHPLLGESLLETHLGSHL